MIRSTTSLLGIVLVSVAAALVAPACGADTQSVSKDVCASGTQWVGAESGDERMHPGRDCINCHFQSEEDAPRWTLAGTVYGVAGQRSDCFGVAGVTVSVVDAKGKSIVLTSNEAGNIKTLESFAAPYSVTMTSGGKESKSTTPHTSGACNSCHGEVGSQGAAGRLVAPH